MEFRKEGTAAIAYCASAWPIFLISRTEVLRENHSMVQWATLFCIFQSFKVQKQCNFSTDSHSWQVFQQGNLWCTVQFWTQPQLTKNFQQNGWWRGEYSWYMGWVQFQLLLSNIFSNSSQSFYKGSFRIGPGFAFLRHIHKNKLSWATRSTL